MTRDPEVMREEVRRCIREYGNLPGYIFAGFIMTGIQEGQDPASAWETTGVLCEQAIDLVHAYAKGEERKKC